MIRSGDRLATNRILLSVLLSWIGSVTLSLHAYAPLYVYLASSGGHGTDAPSGESDEHDPRICSACFFS